MISWDLLRPWCTLKLKDYVDKPALQTASEVDTGFTTWRNTLCVRVVFGLNNPEIDIIAPNKNEQGPSLSHCDILANMDLATYLQEYMTNTRQSCSKICGIWSLLSGGNLHSYTMRIFHVSFYLLAQPYHIIYLVTIAINPFINLNLTGFNILDLIVCFLPFLLCVLEYWQWARELEKTVMPHNRV